MDWNSGSSDKQKRLGFRALWIPKRKSRKRDNYYVRHTDYSNRSIMASDSPTLEHRTNINFTPDAGRVTPPPTTSYFKAETIPESVSTDVPKEDKDNDNDNDKDESNFSRPDVNPDLKQDQMARKTDSRSGAGRGGVSVTDKKNEDIKLNGGDKLDCKWTSSREVQVKDDSEEKDCAVNCIYYTLQCCECTIT